MIWQDWVIGIGGLALSPALIPMVLAPEAPPLLASVPTTLVLWSYLVAFVTLKMRLSAGTTFISASMWTLLALQGLSII